MKKYKLLFENGPLVVFYSKAVSVREILDTIYKCVALDTHLGFNLTKDPFGDTIMILCKNFENNTFTITEADEQQMAH
jgi:hypothetical protein